MFDIPTTEQWREAFALSQQVLELAPWSTYPEELIFVLNGADREEPLYAAVHGYEDEMVGMMFHETREDVSRYLNILEAGDNAGFQVVIANQNGVFAQVVGSQFIADGDQYAIREAKFVPRDEDSHIVFRKLVPGLTPWYADKNDLALLIEGLKLFLKAVEKPIAPLPEGIAIATLHLDGRVTISPLPDDFKVAPEDVVKDDFYVARLKQLKRTGRTIEVESCYLPNPTEGAPGAPPYFPKFCVIADANEGYIADQCIFDESTKEEDAFFLFLGEYFKKEGLPRKIRINRNNTGHLMRDLCKRLRIELEERGNLPVVDDFMVMINGITPGE